MKAKKLFLSSDLVVSESEFGFTSLVSHESKYSRMSDFRYPEMSVNRSAQCREKNLMDKYIIVFRWLAQVGGASSCMCT